MLYTKIQPRSFLGSEEEDIKNFHLYENGGHLVQWHGTISTKWQYPFDRRPHVKSGEKMLKHSEKRTFTNYTVLYMYIAPKHGQNTIRGQNFDYN